MIVSAEKFKFRPEWYTHTDEQRHGLCLPWTYSESHYAATDTRILIVFPKAWYSGNVDAEGRKPRIDDVLKPMSGVTEWHEFPDIDKCQKCRGKTIIPVSQCKSCSGMGTLECDLGHEHDCYGCNGTGNIYDEECPACWDVMSDVAVGARHLSRGMANRAAALPGVRWGTANDDPTGIVFLKFDGGYGAVMPVVRSLFDA